MRIDRKSLTEAIVNTAIGYCISLISIYVVFPLAGIETTHKQNFTVVLYFTIISVIKNYLVRHYFKKKQK